MKKKILLIMLVLLMLTGCGSKKDTSVVFKGNVHEDTQFDSVFAEVSIEDFMNCGFDFGDSVNVKFSNGLELSDIPYYSGYYTRKGEPLICGYPGYEFIAITRSSSGLWTESGLKNGDGVEITLNQKAKYLVTQETLSQKYSLERSDYKSDEAFANFRAMTTSKLKDNYLFRGASPCDDTNKRVEIVNTLLEKNGINYVITLSNSEEEFLGYGLDESLYINKLYKDNKIIFLDMTADYGSEAYMSAVCNGFKQILENDGPFYIHCLEGKDRTGFVCLLLEAIAGSDIEEMKADYMQTYDNYYGVTKESDPNKYDAIENLYFEGFVDFLKEPLKDNAYNYLLDSGMSASEIDSLVAKISK